MSGSLISVDDTGVIVVDVQADFTELKSGALAVPGTDIHYIDDVQKATRRFQAQGLRIYFTLDWHPVDHISFYTNNPGTEPFQEVEIEEGRTQVMWPPHCVQNTPGAMILNTADGPVRTVQKGMGPKFDSYSGFADDGGHKTELGNLLQEDGIKKVLVYGLATDYCVLATGIDARARDYPTTMLAAGMRAVDLQPGDGEKALAELRLAGAFVDEG